ncbi:hypothetical protein JTB14_033261 [Gonioctena quinquepunctata]|nr:hypothetical protein JTB14_033261 [Gonioctena quinquepunctata]
MIQKIQQDIWKRWHREYLHTLQQRGKWLKPQSTSPEVGSLVVIKDDNSPPCRWMLTRVVELHSGRDGTVRVATVKTSSGILKRPLVKLCPLPSPDQDSS